MFEKLKEILNHPRTIAFFAATTPGGAALAQRPDVPANFTNFVAEARVAAEDVKARHFIKAKRKKNSEPAPRENGLSADEEVAYFHQQEELAASEQEMAAQYLESMNDDFDPEAAFNDFQAQSDIVKAQLERAAANKVLALAKLAAKNGNEKNPVSEDADFANIVTFSDEDDEAVNITPKKQKTAETAQPSSSPTPTFLVDHPSSVVSFRPTNTSPIDRNNNAPDDNLDNNEPAQSKKRTRKRKNEVNQDNLVPSVLRPVVIVVKDTTSKTKSRK